MLSTSSEPAAAGPKLLHRTTNPTIPASTDRPMSAPNSTSDTGSPSKACTDCTSPEREMNVPTMTNENVRHAHITDQRLNAPRWRYTVKLWMSATPTSHDSKLAFSTGSQPQ